MDEILLIRPTAQTDHWEWGVVNCTNGTCVRCGTDSPDRVCQEAQGREAILLLPGQDVRLEWIEAPPGRGAELRTAVAYLLEEQLCERVEDLHFALGPRDAAGRLATAVIHRDLLQSWLTNLSGLGISLGAAVPEMLAMPWEEGTVTAAVMADRFLVRLDTCVGYAVDPVLAAELVIGLPASAADALLVLYRIGQETPPVSVAQAIQEKGFGEVKKQEFADPMALFARGFSDRRWPLNLLQGDFAPRPRRSMARRLRPAMVVALLALATHIGWSMYDLHQLHARQAVLQTESEAAFRKAFPQVRRIVDLQTQAEQELKALGSRRDNGGDFLRTFGVIGELLHKQPGLKLNGFNFDEGNFDLQLEADAIGTVEKLTAQLKAKRLSGKIVSTEKRDNRILTRLSVTGRGT